MITWGSGEGIPRLAAGERSGSTTVPMTTHPEQQESWSSHACWQGEREDLNRGVLFAAFAGEELGLLGSRYYTRHPTYPLERTVAMLNLDMIGRLREGKLYVGGVGTSPVFQSKLEELGTEEDLALSPQLLGVTVRVTTHRSQWKACRRSSSLPVVIGTTTSLRTTGITSTLPEQSAF